MFRCNYPDELEVQAEVLMHNHVPKRNDLVPWDFDVRFTNFARHAPASFAKQRQPVQNRALGERIAEESLPASLGKLAN
jgi:hypothetical protein